MTTLGPDGIEYPNIVFEGVMALEDGDYNRFQELLENGLDINSIGAYNNSFLLVYVYHLNVENVHFLLENGIDPNSVDRNGLTPLNYIYTLPTMRIYSDDEVRRSNIIRDMLRDSGGYTSRELERFRPKSIDSVPSDPDYELMRNQAATQIQRKMRGRQLRQNRNLTRRNRGRESMYPTMRERHRRFTDHNRMLDDDDLLSGYLHDVYFPPEASSKVSSKSSSKGKRKVAKRTKNKRNRRNRY